MEAPFVWIDGSLAANVMDEGSAIGAERAQGGQKSLEVVMDRDELPVQQRYPLSTMIFLVSSKPLHVAAMR